MHHQVSIGLPQVTISQGAGRVMWVVGLLGECTVSWLAPQPSVNDLLASGQQCANQVTAGLELLSWVPVWVVLQHHFSANTQKKA